MKNSLLTIISFLFALTVSAQVNFNNNTVSAENYSSAIGVENTSTGLSSFASGKFNTADGMYSVAIGYGNSSNGASSFLGGVYNEASGTGSLGLGLYLRATQFKSFIIGTGYNYENPMFNNVSNSLMIGFGSTKPTFFVAEATGSDETGKVGIGDVTEPQAKLHIKLDYGEFTALRLEPWSWTNDNYSEIQFGDEECSIRGTHAAGLKFYSPYKFVFHTGNVGIGVPYPLAKLQVNGDVFIEDENSGLILKSPDGQCWKITVNNSGELTTTSINCNLTTGNTSAIQPEKGIIRIYPNPTKDLVTIENNNTVPVFATLRDLNGTLITTQKLQPGDNNLSLQDMATGYYIITILDNQNQVLTSEKIMKK
jgi:hypothetical protein